MTLNVELLEKVKAKIRKHPEDLQMDTWECGTVACIAGHIIKIACATDDETTCEQRREICGGGEWSTAAALLINARYQDAVELFMGDWWIDDDSDYQQAKTDEERAEVACAEIDRFIERHS